MPKIFALVEYVMEDISIGLAIPSARFLRALNVWASGLNQRTSTRVELKYGVEMYYRVIGSSSVVLLGITSDSGRRVLSC